MFFPVVCSERCVSYSLVAALLGGVYLHFKGHLPGSLLKNSSEAPREKGPALQALLLPGIDPRDLPPPVGHMHCTMRDYTTAELVELEKK